MTNQDEIDKVLDQVDRAAKTIAIASVIRVVLFLIGMTIFLRMLLGRH